MREFTFDIIYHTDADELMDIFLNNGDIRSKSLACCMNEEQFWQLDRVTGAESALEDIESVLTSIPEAIFTISERVCDGAYRQDVIERAANRRVIFTSVSDITICDSIPRITNRYVSGGVLFEITRHQEREHWRILMQNDDKVGMLYDTLGARLRDGLEFRFGSIEDVSESPIHPLGSVSLPPEQRQVLQVAAENGYYETPREVTLDEIATELDCPRSTISYRLRRAESTLVEEFISRLNG